MLKQVLPHLLHLPENRLDIAIARLTSITPLNFWLLYMIGCTRGFNITKEVIKAIHFVRKDMNILPKFCSNSKTISERRFYSKLTIRTMK